MENKLKYDTIVIEGIDKTGKDLLMSYLFHMDKGKYLHVNRGILSVLSYNELYCRKQQEYDLTKHKHELFIYLDVEYEDWYVRIHHTNELLISFEKNKAAFENNIKKLEKSGCKIVRFNTSKMTPFDISKEIIKLIEKLNEE